MEILAVTFLANGLGTGREQHQLYTALYERTSTYAKLLFIITGKEFKHGKASLKSTERPTTGWERLPVQTMLTKSHSSIHQLERPLP